MMPNLFKTWAGAISPLVLVVQSPDKYQVNGQQGHVDRETIFDLIPF